MEQWITVQMGGPAGPFWGVMSDSGRVIALQILDEATANEVVGLHAERDDLAAKLDAAYAELHRLRIRLGEFPECQ